MITHTLTLRYGPLPRRRPQAWLLGGDDPAGWLDELVDWNVPHQSILLYPVPRGRDDRRPLGVLATVAGKADVAPPPRGIPYGAAAGRLFIPVEAWFDPAVADGELASLLSDQYTYVWHPTAGLVAFDTGDVLGIGALLAVGPERERDWDRATAGVALCGQIVSLTPEETLTIEHVFDAGRDGIGDDSDSLSELEPSPDEPKPGMFHAAGRGARRFVAGVVRWFTQHAPTGASEPTWVDRLEQWANKQLTDYRNSLDAKRNKEILRLMHLLENDPDRGLRFALPIGGDAHRGLAPPGGQLTPRNVDFNLARLGGGRAADYWDVSPNYQSQLLARYRELAGREIRLGRHRRAAYILAELLGDLPAAASALESGNHWREAAVLYRKRLNRPADAARCLEQGGLWMEAVALYEELGEYEKAGDLYRKLDQQDNAEMMYREAVGRHRGSGDLISAARLLEEKMDLPDEALQTLESGWPQSRQSGACLQATFRLLGRMQRHEAAQAWIARLRSQPIPANCRMTAVDTLASQAAEYPDPATRARAADGTRAIVSGQLPSVNQAEARRLLAAIVRLVPGDRVLARDCQRYPQKIQSPKPKPARPAALQKSTEKSAMQIRRIELAPQMQWLAVVGNGSEMVAAGVGYGRLVLARCNWDGEAELAGSDWQLQAGMRDSGVLLAGNPSGGAHVVVHVLGGPPLEGEVTCAPSNRFPSELRAGTVRGMSQYVVGLGRTSHGVTWLVDLRDRQLTLTAVGRHQELLSSVAVPPQNWRDLLDSTSIRGPVPIHVRGNRVYLGAGHRLVVFGEAGEPEITRYDKPVRSITASTPHTRTRVAISFPHGGVVRWEEYEGEHEESFAVDLPEPLACFNRGGYLIAASTQGWDIYQTQNRRLELVAQRRGNFPEPIAVIPAPRADRFAIATADGSIAIYEIT